jgi:hypothetical protein
MKPSFMHKQKPLVYIPKFTGWEHHELLGGQPVERPAELTALL